MTDDLKQLETHWEALERGKEEAVHEVRKLSRKAGATLKALEAPKKIQRAWRAIRRAVAPLRDWDVLRDLVKTRLKELEVSKATLQKFQEDWQLEREKRFGYLVLPVKPHAFESPKHGIKLLEEALEDEWPRLKRDAKRILSLEPSAAWHDWRKKLKHYRYLLEALERDVTDLKVVLEGLGRIQDAEILISTLEDLASFPSVSPELRLNIVALERKAMLEAAETVRSSWTQFKAAGGGII